MRAAAAPVGPAVSLRVRGWWLGAELSTDGRRVRAGAFFRLAPGARSLRGWCPESSSLGAVSPRLLLVRLFARADHVVLEVRDLAPEEIELRLLLAADRCRELRGLLV